MFAYDDAGGSELGGGARHAVGGIAMLEVQLRSTGEIVRHNDAQTRERFFVGWAVVEGSRAAGWQQVRQVKRDGNARARPKGRRRLRSGIEGGIVRPCPVGAGRPTSGWRTTS